jgi:aldose 1-epimerase
VRGKSTHTEFIDKVWNLIDSGDNFVLFGRRSPDGEGGCPGNVDLTVRYMWVDYNRLVIDLTAVCDQDIPVSLTSSLYFNLDGEGTIVGNKLRVVRG